MFLVFQSEPETASSGCVVFAQFSHLHSVPGKKLQYLKGWQSHNFKVSEACSYVEFALGQ